MLTSATTGATADAAADAAAVTEAEDRFAFGANWLSFVKLVDEARVATATRSLTAALGSTDLRGRDFLDVGCGSGLFSLAAHRLGARVWSFDYDRQSVAATTELRRRFGGPDGWTVGPGSALDTAFLTGLGDFDVVYAWGVLHHTGDMWRAIDNTSRLVRLGGLLFISIYNDQGQVSRVWRRVKRRYNRSGRWGRAVLVVASSLYLYRHAPVTVLARLVRRRPLLPRRTRERGMSVRHDLVDWVGGYPFEVARPEEVFAFLRERGFELRHLRTCAGGLGCNEYVLQRVW
jgi:2-polyprenyl-3-methyl-5-hydroxy-6-metoxy-1,4-benzoquinol methylase